MNRYLFILFFLLGHFSFAQLLKISVADKDNHIISQPVNIYFKESNSQNIKEFITLNKPLKIYQIKKNYTNLLIEVKTFGYKPAKFEIKQIKKDKTYKISFHLIKVEQLKTVVLLSRKKISFKKDTVTYDVQSLKSKNDKKLQDLLVKLPGIEVNPSTGLIKFKGKPIETVLLDGDNLFNSNYTIGTKNINLSVIDKIQAIDHYNSNPLLKKIEKSEKTVLNLVLKKNITDFSGDIDFLGGINNNLIANTDIGIDLLGINKKYKNFSIINFNNIGTDYSPYNIFLQRNSQNKMRYYTAYNPIQTIFPADKTQNFNNQLFINENLLLKLSKKTSLTNNIFLLKDQQYRYIENQSVFFIGRDTLKLISDENRILKPKVYKFNFNLTSKLSQKSYLIDKLSIAKQLHSNELNIYDSYLSHLKTNQKNENIYFSNYWDFTRKINQKNALKLSNQISYDKYNQLFLRDGETPINQVYKGKRLTTTANIGWLRMNNVNNHLSLNLQAAYHQYYLFSLQQNLPVSLKTNSYDILELSQSFSQNLKLGKIDLNPKYSLFYYRLYRKTKKNQSKFGFKAVFNTNYQINKLNKIFLSFAFNKQPLSTDRLFNFKILKNYRNSVKYVSEFLMQNSYIVNGQYHFTNSYPIINFRAGFQLQYNLGFLYPDIFIDQTMTYIKYRYLPNWQQSGYYFLYFDKLLSRLKSTLTIKADYLNTKSLSSINHIKQWINYQSTSFSFNFSTAFKGHFNFSNQFKYQLLYNENYKTHTLNGMLRVFYSVNKIDFVIEQTNHFLNKKNYFSITDVNFNYRPNKKYEIKFKIKNLFNNESYKTVNLTDKSYYLTSYKLLPRMWLIGFVFNY